MNGTSKLFDPPWERAEWLAAARAWMEAELGKQGRALSSAPQAVHRTPWSAVLRGETEAGAVFFKAGAPNQAFEAGLLAQLADWHPDATLRPLALDAERGWMLLPDGGRTLRQAELSGDKGRKVWERMLGEFAELQQALSGRVEGMLAAGAPDRRPGALPGLFGLVEQDAALLRVGLADGMSAASYARLRGMEAELTAWCAALEASGLPASLDHGDLHSGNVFLGEDGELTFFDWGDATVGHPFFSLMVPLRVLGNEMELLDGEERLETDAELKWARRAYLEAWTGFAPMAELLEIWALALRVGKFQRSLSWHAVLKSIAPESLRPYRGHWVAWLEEFLEGE